MNKKRVSKTIKVIKIKKYMKLRKNKENIMPLNPRKY